MTGGSFGCMPVTGPLVAQVKCSSSNFSEGFLELRAALRLKPPLDDLTDRRRVRSWKATPECLYILREGQLGVTPGDCSASGLPKQAPSLGRGVAVFLRILAAGGPSGSHATSHFCASRQGYILML